MLKQSDSLLGRDTVYIYVFLDTSEYIVYTMYMIRWNEEKAAWLQKERGIKMPEVAQIIKNEQFLAIEKVPSQDNHPGQMMFIILLNGYIYCAPFVIEETGNIFIKTVFPSRKLNAKYKGEHDGQN